jgi:hypothetical protein
LWRLSAASPQKLNSPRQLDATCVHVVDETRDRQRVGDQRVRGERLDVDAHGAVRIADELATATDRKTARREASEGAQRLIGGLLAR